MKRIVYLILLLNTFAFSSTSPFNISHFEGLSQHERYNYIHQFEYWQVSNPDSLAGLFDTMWQVANQQSDIHATIAINYYCAFSYLTPGFTIPNN